MLLGAAWTLVACLSCCVSGHKKSTETPTTTTCSPTPSSTSSLNFGSCSNPRINYGFDIDDSDRYGYAPADQDQFPHSWSPDVASVESFICNRLASDCNADSAAVTACQSAFNLFSGLSGDLAVEAWNQALGLSTSGACLQQGASVEITTITVIATPRSSGQQSITTETVTTKTTETSTSTDEDATSTTVPSPTTTLTITLTLPASSTTASASSASSTSTTTSTLTQTHSTTATVAAQSAKGSGSSGNGSPFDQNAAGTIELHVLRVLAIFGLSVFLGLL